MSRITTTQKAYAAFLAVCIFWGTTYLGIKIALETVPPFLLGGHPVHACRDGAGGVVATHGAQLAELAPDAHLSCDRHRDARVRQRRRGLGRAVHGERPGGGARCLDAVLDGRHRGIRRRGAPHAEDHRRSADRLFGHSPAGLAGPRTRVLRPRPGGRGSEAWSRPSWPASAGQSARPSPSSAFGTRIRLSPPPSRCSPADW